MWGHGYPCFGLLVMSALGFKARVDPLACMLCCCAMKSSDSLLVQHLLTCWWQAWQPIHSHPHTCENTNWWGSRLGSIVHIAASQCETRQTLYQLGEKYYVLLLGYQSKCDSVFNILSYLNMSCTVRYSFVKYSDAVDDARCLRWFRRSHLIMKF